MAALKHDHTHLTSPDPERTIEFYTKVMGAKLVKEQESGGIKLVDLELGGIPIRISGQTGADKAWQGPRYGLHHLGLTVDDMDAFVAELKSKGVEFVVEPTQARPGLRFAFIKAPDNVLFEILEIKQS
ncbi:MAG TPA: VOC family protein [Dehalococcoidia bacterium]|jgi:catechol 2,3-dioxygenase-like lactoylglutathione lyase family enzyme|nr:VOC family protein [Dehalococcoidia bacterium]